MNFFLTALYAITLYMMPAVFLCAEEESPALQVTAAGFAVVPEKPYIGDASVMRYTFTAPRDFLAGEIFTAGTAGGAETAVLPFDADYFEQGGMTVTAVSLSRRASVWSAESEFSLEIMFVPWKTGVVFFPPIKIFGLKTGEFAGEIIIPEFTVHSLVETLGETRMRPALPPLIIPGTTYILISALIGLAVFAAFVVLFTRSRFFARFVARLKLSRGAKAALRRIKKLRGRVSDMDDAECAREISSLVREYLTRRFFAPFIAFTPDETAQNLSLVEPYENTVGKIAADKCVFSLLKRCELIRFSPDARFSGGERAAMLRDSRGAILYFEHSGGEW